MQVVDEAIPCSYFECDTSFSAAEITVCILDYLYWKLDELCPVQGGEVASSISILLEFSYSHL